jgi:hypothetical protein
LGLSLVWAANERNEVVIDEEAVGCVLVPECVPGHLRFGRQYDVLIELYKAGLMRTARNGMRGVRGGPT